MKVYIIAAMTADGFIARGSNELINWTSPEDKKFFRETTNASGVVLMGGNTYRTFKSPLPGRRNIVYSHRKIDDISVETTQENPFELVKRLGSEGVDELAVIGGSTIYTLFVKTGLVTDIYLSIEPKIFGNGIKLFNEDLDVELSLVDSKNLNKNTLLLHYRVAN